MFIEDKEEKSQNKNLLLNYFEHYKDNLKYQDGKGISHTGECCFFYYYYMIEKGDTQFEKFSEVKNIFLISQEYEEGVFRAKEDVPHQASSHGASND